MAVSWMVMAAAHGLRSDGIQPVSGTLPSRQEEQRLAAIDDPGGFQQWIRVQNVVVLKT
ncbi:MAG: hypothetical protein VKI42_10230 [Synechococcaceae cyanobacterium]|nr:hypothetical protein [Synechococcaceae cyanobacterium]